MADRFQPVSVGIEDEGRVVIGMVAWSQARQTIVAAAAGQGGGMKRVDGDTAVRLEGDVLAFGRVRRRTWLTACTDPERGLRQPFRSIPGCDVVGGIR